jgi:hypothetical protein
VGEGVVFACMVVVRSWCMGGDWVVGAVVCEYGSVVFGWGGGVLGVGGEQGVSECERSW